MHRLERERERGGLWVGVGGGPIKKDLAKISMF